MEKQRIFVDMDGTLYEWRKNVPEEAIFQKYYYLTLKPQKNIVSAVRELAKDDRYDVSVLSAVLSDKENPYALAEKNQRIDLDLPEIDKAHRIFCPCGVPKAKYIPGGIRQNDILLDDYSHNLHEWGGIGIKVINDVNGRHGTWLGERIYANTTPRVLVKKITEIAEQTREKETQTKETTFLIPADRSDPCVYFHGTKEEQEEADRIEEERKALWQSILDLPGFLALEFDRGDDSVILSPSVHEGVKWQLTWFSNRDGEANMDATYGGEKATHPESELIDALYRETRTTGARVSVVTEQSLMQKEEELER
ncbi:hypothetical protein ACKX2L_06035 [Lachnospiraceae bacterium YH-ros2228]